MKNNQLIKELTQKYLSKNGIDNTVAQEELEKAIMEIIRIKPEEELSKETSDAPGSITWEAERKSPKKKESKKKISEEKFAREWEDA